MLYHLQIQLVEKNIERLDLDVVSFESIKKNSFIPFLAYESIDVSFQFFWNCKSKEKQTQGTNEYVNLVWYPSSRDKICLCNTNTIIK